jgi:DNA-binding PadR family transcriptional regulator
LLEFIILGFLMHGDMSGYDIKQFMSQSTSYFFDASFGSIYPMLKKLEDAKSVTLMEGVEDGKYRKLYSITDEGRRRFLNWLEQPIELNRSGHSHLIRIFFYSWLEPAAARALVEGFIARVEAELKALVILERRVEGQACFYELSTLDYGKRYYDFTISWCREFIERSSRLEQAGEIEKRGMKE